MAIGIHKFIKETGRVGVHGKRSAKWAAFLHLISPLLKPLETEDAVNRWSMHNCVQIHRRAS